MTKTIAKKRAWKDIPEYEGKYFISTEGEIMAKIKNKEYLKKQTPIHKRGEYLYVTLCGKKNRYLSVHRIVAKTFIPNPNNYPCVNHKDSNRRNNKVENLEWVSRKMNYEHSMKKGKARVTRGQDCIYATLNDEQVKKIIHLRIKYKNTYMDLAKKFNVSYSTIAHIMRGTRWSHIWNSLGLSPIARKT
jgi:hypothetical protein